MINVETLQLALQQLSQAIHRHEQWYRALVRSVSCQLPYDGGDVAEDAHRQCDFGRWYYSGDIPQELRDQPAFVSLESDHEQMHWFAARLLRVSMNGLPVSAEDYDKFAQALDQMHQKLYGLKRQIEESLYGHDPLTGMENRIGMLAKLREDLELIKRRVGQSCIGIMDLDRFKEINDRYGHLVGDRVLSAAAHRIMEHVRPYDKVFRYGGDEFLISMPNTGLEAGQTVVERIREELASSVLIQHDGKPISIKVSFGITLLDPDVGIEESIDRADRALYAAKTAGRNCVCVWTPSMTNDSMARATPGSQHTIQP